VSSARDEEAINSSVRTRRGYQAACQKSLLWQPIRFVMPFLIATVIVHNRFRQKCKSNSGRGFRFHGWHRGGFEDFRYDLVGQISAGGENHLQMAPRIHDKRAEI